MPHDNYFRVPRTLTETGPGFLMKQRSFFFLLVCVQAFLVSGGTRKLSKPYQTLSQIQSPYELIAGYFPKNYSVPVTFSGSIAEEIKEVLDTLDIAMVQHRETFDRKYGFQLDITNKDYTTQTRDLLSGILNPIEMTDIVLNSVLKYRDTETLIQIQKETVITTKREKYKGMPITIITLTPKGKRFCYRYKDMGAYVHESWLTQLSCTFDPATMHALRLSLKKFSRMFASDQDNQPEPVESSHNYVFTYETIENHIVPSRLDFHVDSTLNFTLAASYRKADDHIVFDKREIIYYLPNKSTSRLIIQYHDYSFSGIVRTEPVTPTDKYSKKLKRAASLSRKAIAALNKGNIHRATDIMQTIIDNYPGTPQAVEAQKLLSGLPHGL